MSALVCCLCLKGGCLHFGLHAEVLGRVPATWGCRGNSPWQCALGARDQHLQQHLG